MKRRTTRWLARSALILALLATSCSSNSTTISSSETLIDARPEELPLRDNSTTSVKQQAVPPATTMTETAKSSPDVTVNSQRESRLRRLFDETLTAEQWACVDTTDTTFNDSSVAEAIAILDCAPQAVAAAMVSRHADRFGLEAPLSDFSCLAERVDPDGYRRAAAAHLLTFEGHVELPADFASSFATGHATCMPVLLMGELAESHRVLFVGHQSEIAARSMSRATNGECIRALSESPEFTPVWDEIANQLINFTGQSLVSYANHAELRPLLFDCVAIGTLLEIQASEENLEVPDLLVQCLNDTVTGQMFLLAVETRRLDPNNSNSLLSDCVNSANADE